MQTLPVRLVAIDLDGTLFNSRQQISPRTVAAIQSARDAGIELCIATGRRHTFAWKSLSCLDLAPDAVILSSNGAVVRRRDGLLLGRTQLDRDLALQLCREVGPHRERLVFTFDKVDSDPAAPHHPGSLLMETSGPLAAIIERWIAENRADILELPNIEDGLNQDAPIQAMVCGSIAPMRALEEQLRHSEIGPRLTVHRTEYPQRDLSIVDILPVGCGKGIALAGLAHQRGLQTQQVAAIGDNFNDEAMLDYAGHSYLMANAAEELLSKARKGDWRLVPSNDEDGVAVALEELVELIERNHALQSHTAVAR